MIAFAIAPNRRGERLEDSRDGKNQNRVLRGTYTLFPQLISSCPGESNILVLPRAHHRSQPGEWRIRSPLANRSTGWTDVCDYSPAGAYGLLCTFNAGYTPEYTHSAHDAPSAVSLPRVSDGDA